MTIPIVCEAKSPGMTRPAEPIVQSNSLECGPNTQSLYKSQDKEDSSSQLTTYDYIWNDLALGINSLDYAAAGQYDQALLVAKTINSSALKEKVLGTIAGELAAAGQYNKALQIAKTIKDDFYKQRALGAIARALATVGQYDKALQVAKTIKHYYKEEALGAIARELSAVGHYDKALGIVQTIQDSRLKAKSLTDIAIKQVAAGKTDQADHIFAQALKAAETIAGFDTNTLEELAHQLADAGQYAQAQQFAQLIRDDSTNTRQKVLKAIAHDKKSP